MGATPKDVGADPCVKAAKYKVPYYAVQPPKPPKEASSAPSPPKAEKPLDKGDAAKVAEKKEAEEKKAAAEKKADAPKKADEA